MSQAPIRPMPRPLMLAATREGFVVGLALTCALVGVQYVGFALIGVPFVPRDLSGLSPIKSSLLTGACAILVVLIGGALSGLYGAIRVRFLMPFPRNDRLDGLLLGAIAFLLTLPVEAASTWRLTIPPVGAVGLLVTYVWWGLAVNQSIRGAAARPITSGTTDSPLLTRRNFLLQTAAGGLLIALLSLPTAWIIENRPISFPNLSSILSPNPSPTQKPTSPKSYF